MIVSFDPAITGGAYAAANTEAYYVNFLRCVTAIATANAGTTSLTVNPYIGLSTVTTPPAAPGKTVLTYNSSGIFTS